VFAYRIVVALDLDDAKQIEPLLTIEPFSNVKLTKDELSLMKEPVLVAPGLGHGAAVGQDHDGQGDDAKHQHDAKTYKKTQSLLNATKDFDKCLSKANVFIPHLAN
jgi:hypothetical protein